MNQPRKLLEILELSSQHLADRGIENPRLNAERLLAYLLKFNRVSLYMNFDRPMDPEELEELRELLRRRTRHEPLQYILGETEFYSLPFKTDSRALIPRPETEILVEKALDICQEYFSDQRPVQLLDVGTGSGAIAVTMAAQLDSAQVTALDISEDALSLAAENAVLNGVDSRITFLHQSIENLKPAEKFSVILSNPPYVTTAEYGVLPPEIKQYEPKVALEAGSDGMDVYRVLAKRLPEILEKGGFFLAEIGASQGELIKALFQTATSVSIQPDLAGHDRVAVIQI